MKTNCFGCGVEKDTSTLEFYPYPDEDGITDEPIEPFFILDCQGPIITNDPDGYCEFRMVVVCHTCFHKLEPDMWISKGCWEVINPVIPYEKLPMWVEGVNDAWMLKPLP
jgi:hypothetical protein